MTIQLPPIQIEQDTKTKLWTWKAPNGATGSHEKSARAAAISAVSGMHIPLKDVELPEPEKQ